MAQPGTIISAKLEEVKREYRGNSLFGAGHLCRFGLRHHACLLFEGIIPRAFILTGGLD
jgi:hypothetical protein